MTSRTRRTPKNGNSLARHSDAVRAKALVAFREAGTVAEACKAAGIGRRTWYDWIERDEAFASAVRDASEEVLDDLEKEAIQRAKDGSDTLIIFLLKCLRREKYQDRARVELDIQNDPRIRRFAEIFESVLRQHHPESADAVIAAIKSALKAEKL